MIPYLIWSLLSFLAKGNYTFERLLKIGLTPDAYYWFLWVLFWIFVLFWIVRRLAHQRKVNELVLLWMATGILIVMMIGLNTRYFGFRFIAYYFFFYTLGYCLHKVPRLQIKNKITIVMMTLMWIVLAWGWSMHGLPTYMPTNNVVPRSLVLYAYRGITAIVAIEVIFYVAPKLLDKIKNMNLTMIKAGRLSLGIYTIHILLLDVAKPLCWRLMQEIGYMGALIIVFILVCFISLAVVDFINKNKKTAQLLLGKV